MTLSVILEIIQGVLSFPGEVLSLIRVLKGTPDEQKAKIMKSIEDASHDFQSTGRPTWND